MPSTQNALQTSEKTPVSGLMSRIHELGLKPGALSLLMNKVLKKPLISPLLLKGRSGFRSGRAGLSRAARHTGDEISSRTMGAAHSVRRNTKPAKLGKDYKRFLHMTQEIGYDRTVEKLFFVPARGYIPLEHLTIDSPNRHFGHAYHPIHRLSFNWAMAQIPDRLADFTFVDYGAGRGRALVLAATHPFRKVVGVEFAQELQDDATMNIAQFPRSLMKCRDIDCHLMDAVDFPIPQGKGIFLFNDCFDLEVLETVLARITSSYRANPRRIYLIFVRPLKAEVLDRVMERTVIFEPTYHSKTEKMRMQMLSPDQVQIFRSLI